MKDTILIIGAGGQVGSDLTAYLRSQGNPSSVVATDVRDVPELGEDGPFETLDVMDEVHLKSIFEKYRPTVVYHLAALLSATAEQKPMFGWNLNMTGLFNVFNMYRDYGVKRLFWPSSIAVFGPTTPREHTPQHTIMDPTTIYGISKLAGERFCEYYHKRYGVDVRSLRYPGLIGWKTMPGGGTTDYAVDIFHQALKTGSYECFLSEDTALPMMYMDDAIKATVDITEAPAEQIKIRSSYNLSALSFTPRELAQEIARSVDGFEISYQPDHRQQIADSWPKSIDDQHARNDWGWNPQFDLSAMVVDMIKHLK
jgi:nucleoside-diphosphate-sugar epimerase